MAFHFPSEICIEENGRIEERKRLRTFLREKLGPHGPRRQIQHKRPHLEQRHHLLWCEPQKEPGLHLSEVAQDLVMALRLDSRDTVRGRRATVQCTHGPKSIHRYLELLRLALRKPARGRTGVLFPEKP